MHEGDNVIVMDDDVIITHGSNPGEHHRRVIEQMEENMRRMHESHREHRCVAYLSLSLSLSLSLDLLELSRDQ